MKIFKFKYLLQAWWLFAIMIAIALGPKVAYAAEVTMGSGAVSYTHLTLPTKLSV